MVVGAGSAERFGHPKQFAQLGGKPVAEWAVLACRPVANAVVLVLPPSEAEGSQRFGADVLVPGGDTRADSVRCGLALVPSDVDVVVVHDAARPLAAPELFSRVVAALEEEGVGGAVCALPVADTIKRVHPGEHVVLGTLDRRELMSVQTPQAFVAGVLREAHARGEVASDDAALVERLGATVRVVPGDRRNLKLTTPADLTYAEYLLGA